jgi:hypothetical protein
MPPYFARELLCKHFPAAMNTRATTELLDAFFFYAVLVISKEVRCLVLPSEALSEKDKIMVIRKIVLNLMKQND